eukprot:TRINITY_DN69369_c0_g1_i1.p1 TRINITY_DN69369_c0_g1~~TRINITY_DN69369_c0_g1_i1.p1  ORF type:complete len:737 (+),score=132.41 TRINITY_DN69369_c0_g1_i1:326-2212(+)
MLTILRFSPIFLEISFFVVRGKLVDVREAIDEDESNILGTSVRIRAAETSFDSEDAITSRSDEIFPHGSSALSLLANEALAAVAAENQFVPKSADKASRPVPSPSPSRLFSKLASNISTFASRLHSVLAGDISPLSRLVNETLPLFTDTSKSNSKLTEFSSGDNHTWLGYLPLNDTEKAAPRLPKTELDKAYSEPKAIPVSHVRSDVLRRPHDADLQPETAQRRGGRTPTPSLPWSRLVNATRVWFAAGIASDSPDVTSNVSANSAATHSNVTSALQRQNHKVESTVAGTEVPESMVFDCRVDIQDWRQSWSIAKASWCCMHYHLGCHPRITAPFLCDVEYEKWEVAWSTAKKLWCCRTVGIGCLIGPSAPTPLPTPLPTYLPVIQDALTAAQRASNASTLLFGATDRAREVAESATKAATVQRSAADASATAAAMRSLRPLGISEDDLKESFKHHVHEADSTAESMQTAAAQSVDAEIALEKSAIEAARTANEVETAAETAVINFQSSVPSKTLSELIAAEKQSETSVALARKVEEDVRLARKDSEKTRELANTARAQDQKAEKEIDRPGRVVRAVQRLMQTTDEERKAAKATSKILDDAKATLTSLRQSEEQVTFWLKSAGAQAKT